MSHPYDCPTPHHAVILAQTRIRTYSDASLDSCLRRNDGLLVHCWLVQVQVQIRARVPPRHVVALRLPDAPTTPSSSRRRGSIRAPTHHRIPACTGMTGYWCTVGWLVRVRPRHVVALRLPDAPATPSSSRRRGSIPALTHHWIPACAGMTGYWCTVVGWRRCKCRSVRECRRDMSRPYDCPTPYHPVILAPARIHTYSDASLDSCLRRNDGW